ncbi:hypothetical protein DPMN_156382 [Dreissena polymorpha]|uniref:Uncharacterized protein n=1 Tax=Dreissena polymorpha TaxID=45954 RepID=A0A9D4JCB2_DREPO|nr:hypothetical protein DPMN_156382 [Dreissena polymorpha]
MSADRRSHSAVSTTSCMLVQSCSSQVLNKFSIKDSNSCNSIVPANQVNSLSISDLNKELKLTPLSIRFSKRKI